MCTILDLKSEIDIDNENKWICKIETLKSEDGTLALIYGGKSTSAIWGLAGPFAGRRFAYLPASASSLGLYRLFGSIASA